MGREVQYLPAVDDKNTCCGLSPPAGLSVHRFEVDSDEYAVLAFPLPELHPPEALTAAEAAVAIGVAEGWSNEEIAKSRGTSTNTVANQLRRIYERLGISGRAELLRCCAVRRADLTPLLVRSEHLE